MSESIELSPLGLSSLPPALRAQFDAELHHAHEVLWAEREAFEDLAGRGCTLQHQSGVVSATVTLTVRVDLAGGPVPVTGSCPEASDPEHKPEAGSGDVDGEE